jgi:hypothetical protein
MLPAIEQRFGRYGTHRFVRRLNELGIAHRYEEFLDNHSGVNYRMDEACCAVPMRLPDDL